MGDFIRSELQFNHTDVAAGILGQYGNGSLRPQQDMLWHGWERGFLGLELFYRAGTAQYDDQRYTFGIARDSFYNNFGYHIGNTAGSLPLSDVHIPTVASIILDNVPTQNNNTPEDPAPQPVESTPEKNDEDVIIILEIDEKPIKAEPPQANLKPVPPKVEPPKKERTYYEYWTGIPWDAKTPYQKLQEKLADEQISTAPAYDPRSQELDKAWGGYNRLHAIAQNIDAAADATLQYIEFINDVGIGFIPGVGDGRDAVGAATGIDPITGNPLSPADRVLAAVGVVIPVIPFNKIGGLISRLRTLRSSVEPAGDLGSQQLKQIDSYINQLETKQANNAQVNANVVQNKPAQKVVQNQVPPPNGVGKVADDAKLKDGTGSASRGSDDVRGPNSAFPDGYLTKSKPVPGGVNQNVVFSGHGFMPDPVLARDRGKQMQFVVPEGTELRVYVKDGQLLANDIGQVIESGGIIHPNDAAHLTIRVFKAGETVTNYVLKQKDKLETVGNPILVDSTTFLDDLLKPGMGPCEWAACLAWDS